MRVRSLVPVVSLFVLTASLAAAAPAREPSRPAARAVALVLRYPFNGGPSLLLRDTSPSGLHGALVNGVAAEASVAGKQGKGKALQLVGRRHQYVSVPQSPALDVDRYTLSALVRYTGVPNDATNGRWEVLEKAGAYWLNVRTDGRVRAGGFYGRCDVSAAWKYLDSAKPIPRNTWTHVASTYNGSTLRVWVNGALAGSRAVSGRTCSNDEPLAVGAKDAPAKGILEAFWDGRLDEVRIYNRALGPEEIATLAAS